VWVPNIVPRGGSRRCQMIAKVRKSVCRCLWQAWACVWQYRGKGLGSRAAKSMRGVQAGLPSESTGELTAARPPERNICAPVMRREPLERPCKSLPKPSRNPRSRSHTRGHNVAAERSGICTHTRHLLCHAQRRNVSPLHHPRLRSLASQTPPLAVCLPSSSACGLLASLGACA
jgi:hypothetical protein